MVLDTDGDASGCLVAESSYVIPCRTCYAICNSDPATCDWVNQLTTQKQLWGLVRQSSSTFLETKSAVNVIGPLNGTYSNKPLNIHKGVNWNQSSDRNVAGIEQRNVSRKNTRQRPGGSGGRGVGVDVKHNSYARFLARKKGKLLTTMPNLSYGAKTPDLDTPIKGNKQYLLGLNNCYYCE